MWSRRLVVGLLWLLVAVVAEWGAWRVPWVENLDRVLYDTRLRWQPTRPTNRIVIVDIDARSLRDHGAWPWARQDLARLTELIVAQGGARVLAFDMVLSESEPLRDASLARVMRDHPVVLGYYFSTELGAMSTGVLPKPVGSAWAEAMMPRGASDWHSYGGNAAVLQEAAQGAGFFNAMNDRDGVLRTMPLLAQYRGQWYDSLPLAALRAYWGQPELKIVGTTTQGMALQLGPSGRLASIPLTEAAGMLVPFQGRGGPGRSRFRYVSAVDVLKGRVDPRLFQDRLVLLGSTAPNLADWRVTPVGESFPGVEIHAAAMAGVLENAVRQPPPYGRALSIGLMLVVGLCAAWVMARLPIWGIVAGAVMGLSALLTLYAVAYAQWGWVMPCAAALWVLLGMAVLNMVWVAAQERRARRAMLGLFGQYVAPQVVARLVKDPHHAPIDGQNKVLTIVFADIRGFTRLAENMDPHQLRDYLNRFLTAMTEVIHSYQGTVDKYMGDAVMAFWGAPVDDPDHADHAVTAALAMQHEIARLNREFEQMGWPSLVVGIGINTGMVRVGDMGSRLRRAYTVIGDAVNLAARLEALTKTLELPILLGEATQQTLRQVRVAYVGQVDVPGRTEPVAVWQPWPRPADWVDAGPSSSVWPAQVAHAPRASSEPVQ